MNVVVDRDYKICNPGLWDGVWKVIAIGAEWSCIEQPGRGRMNIKSDLLRAAGG